jgi:hypothetical protein
MREEPRKKEKKKKKKRVGGQCISTVLLGRGVVTELTELKALWVDVGGKLSFLLCGS